MDPWELRSGLPESGGVGRLSRQARVAILSIPWQKPPYRQRRRILATSQKPTNSSTSWVQQDSSAARGCRVRMQSHIEALGDAHEIICKAPLSERLRMAYGLT